MVGAQAVVARPAGGTAVAEVDGDPDAVAEAADEIVPCDPLRGPAERAAAQPPLHPARELEVARLPLPQHCQWPDPVARTTGDPGGRPGERGEAAGDSGQ